MSNATVDRRTALVALGVATTAGLLGAAVTTRLASDEPAADETAAAPAAPLPPREPGSLVGLLAGPYQAIHATGVEHGAIVVTLRDETGDAFRVTLCARDDSAAALRGPARTAKFDVFVDNEGAGDTPTVERHGLAAMDLASGIRLMEHELDASALLPLGQRLARHGAEINRPPALSGVQRISVGFVCNNACEACPQGSLRDGGPTDDEAVAREVTRAHGIVAFVGGEPTLHPRLLEWIADARTAGATRVVVQTNGRRLAYRAWTVALRGAGADAVDVSLQGSTAAMHEYHTNVAGSFSQTLTGLGIARAAGLEVGVTTVVTRSNYRHLVDIVRLVAARGVKRVHLATLVRGGRAARAWNRLAPNPLLVAPFAAAAVQVGRSLGVVVVEDASGEDTLFSGVGEVETPARAPSRHVSLPVAP